MIPDRVRPSLAMELLLLIFVKKEIAVVRDKLTIRVITGDKISTFVFNNCVGSGSSTHDVVGQHMMVLQISLTVTGQKDQS